MSQLTRHPAFEFVEDQLDAVGQRFRILQICRGAIRWTAWGLILSVTAALAADWAGAGIAARILFLFWLAWLVGSSARWILIPLLRRPSPAIVARMIERRFAALHDGLTNTLLLSQADDLSQSPFLGPIFDEVAANCRTQPLEAAVDFSLLGKLSLRLAAPVAAALVIVVLFPAHLAHGWQQMLAPTTFIPRTGNISILEVDPGNVIRVTGEPLEIQVVAVGSQTNPPPGKLLLDDSSAPLDMTATVRSDGDFLYAYRIEHVDKPLRYRVEISGSQSDWFALQLAEKVSLTSMDVTITPPQYTHQPAHKLTLTAHDADHAQWLVPQGSRLEIGAGVDVAAKNAVLLLNSDAPLPMSTALEGRRFFCDTTVLGDAIAYVGILGGDQIIAKLPENGVSIRTLPDAPPTVVMQYPMQDVTLPPTDQLTIRAQLRDDYGLSSARLVVGFGSADPAPLPETEQVFADTPTARVAEFPLKLTADQTKADSSITLQVEATDNRDLTSLSSSLGPQSTRGPKIVIRFADPKQIAQQQAEQSEKLSTRLQEMIKLQQTLSDKTHQTLSSAGGPTTQPVDSTAMTEISSGQTQLRDLMKHTADQFEFTDATRIVQKTLQVLAVNAAADAIDLASQGAADPVVAAQLQAGLNLTVKQASILESLRTLLARLNGADKPTTQPDGVASPSLPSRVEAFKKLDDALKAYEKEQQKVLNQTAPLAKKPVADYDAADKKNLDDLRMSQDKLDAFMQEALADFSKDANQDMSNPSLVKELMSVYSEVTMAADALNKQPAEVAVPLEEEGLEGAEELKSNIEKWLANKPDRDEWTQEDPLTKNDPQMADLPKELDDMVGDLLEQQEDLDQKMEDANANWQDSMDQAIGWDAQDGPIADMSAKGITDNTLPNNNEMQGRSGEGRTGQSSGEFVGDSAVGKGGRNTPTRLDPTPFEAGQIKDTSKDPVGGATGGGKVSGAGSAGLEGPVPLKEQEEMQRLAKMQAQIRNTAEKLNLQYKLGRYDNFKLLQSIVNMRRVESDLQSNRYQNALRQANVAVDDLDTSAILVGGRMNVQEDTTPVSNLRGRKEVEDAAQGDLPPVWSDSLREYYRKLAEQ